MTQALDHFLRGAGKSWMEQEKKNHGWRSANRGWSKRNKIVSREIVDGQNGSLGGSCSTKLHFHSLLEVLIRNHVGTHEVCVLYNVNRHVSSHPLSGLKDVQDTLKEAFPGENNGEDKIGPGTRIQRNHGGYSILFMDTVNVLSKFLAGEQKREIVDGDNGALGARVFMTGIFQCLKVMRVFCQYSDVFMKSTMSVCNREAYFSIHQALCMEASQARLAPILTTVGCC